MVFLVVVFIGGIGYFLYSISLKQDITNDLLQKLEERFRLNEEKSNKVSDYDDESLYEEAKEIVLSAGKASASLLQRRLSIGYARASHILDKLEEEGIVGPANGATPREVLQKFEKY